jgi:biopolymer transport protein TolR
MRAPKNDLIQAEISLAPLIDVCLVLMIVLLVVVPMVRVGAAASSGPARPAPAAPRVLAIEEPPLAVLILADGSLMVDSKPVQPIDLHRVLGEVCSLTPNRSVIVKADRRLRYEQVRWVLHSVNSAGFRRAGLSAER